MGLLDLFKAKVSNNRVDLSKRYAFHREAFSGTMSKFHKAKDLRTGQIVGLKVLDLVRTAAFEDRFRGLNKPTEGELGMTLKHPLLVETLEHGTASDGSQYIVLEFIDGPDFNSLIIAKDPVLEGSRGTLFTRPPKHWRRSTRPAIFIATWPRETSFSLTAKTDV